MNRLGGERSDIEDEDDGDLDVLQAYVVDVVDGVDACGDPRLDSSRVMVVGVAADLLDMA